MPKDPSPISQFFFWMIQALKPSKSFCDETGKIPHWLAEPIIYMNPLNKKIFLIS